MSLRIQPALVLLALFLYYVKSHSSNGHLQWLNITNATERGALCNDFSPAGYFLHLHSSNNTTLSNGWIIYLESGGGCTTPKSCNTRFIHQPIRNNYTRSINNTNFVDVNQAWTDYKNNTLAATSRLMTTLWRFSGNNDSTWMVDGRGLLSASRIENPSFYNYNHVLIPYCSSDLWLKKTKDFARAKSSSFQFRFDPNATHNQFTFRGAAIFQCVIEDLFEYYGLDNAREVILAGSSAGGIGAMNHAPWLRDELKLKTKAQATVYCLMDSSWFIDFRGSIREQFAPEEIQPLVETNEVVETCHNASSDPTICISALGYFTRYKNLFKDIPTFVLFSKYDLYLLLSSLQHVDIDVLLIMRIVSEYSGSMNASLLTVATDVPNLSYYVTSCFQHVYLATSTLWGEGNILGTAGVDGELKNNRFQHIISSDTWTKFHLEHLNTSLAVEHISIGRAIQNWLEAVKSGNNIRYQDQCNGPHCNTQCPETIILGENTPYWQMEAQGFLLGIVIFMSLVCVVVKVLLSLRACYQSRKQKKFVEWNSWELDDDLESALPYCSDSDAISVACLNLRYSVTVKHSDLKKASSPAQRKRMLSLAAADTEKTLMPKDSEQHLDSEMDHTLSPGIEENVFAQSIREFQNMHGEQKKHKKQLIHHVRAYEAPQKKQKKTILNGITTYFNPGELVAIMGPSGCGKTTFLDLLAGRQNARDKHQGELLVNGIPMNEICDWYVANTGYVLQLATPYYEELTVRENITLAAQMRLPKTLSMEAQFERVEQVMKEAGLNSLSSTVVGGATGPGLSGGQKRRLCVALQLINMPSFIFLDEPTSGLDATSSLELLSHLHRVASSNRAVVLTIHQPRLEIFHMFDKVILLCQGQIAYHGIPDKAYEVFLEANQAKGRKMDSSKNPADAIMDMLGSDEARAAILTYYQKSDEPEAVENAIEEVRCMGRETVSSRQAWGQRPQQESGVLNRLTCMEARASKRAGLGQVLYLPVIFIVYGLLLGTVYIQTSNPTFILSGYGVFSCASGLFMFPIVYTYLYKALEIFTQEYSDGVGSPIELVLQTFIRFSSLAFLPNLLCSSAIYLLAVPYSHYNLWVFVQITAVAFSINHTWIALVMFVITARPDFAHRISPVLSAIAGFAGGFFVPPRLMPPWYSWLFYLNPNYYGFSSMTRILLENIDLGCDYQSPIECFPSSAAYILTYFDLHTVNPYLNLLVLLAMTFLLLVLAWLSLVYRHSYIMSNFKKLFNKKKKLESPKASLDQNGPINGLPQSSSLDSILSIVPSIEYTEEEFKKVATKPKRLSVSTSNSSIDEEEVMTGNRRFRLRNRRTVSRLLQDGENHQVWTPGISSPMKEPLKVSPEERRNTLFQRINTYRGGGDSKDQSKAHPKKGVLNAPCKDNYIRRMAQWKKIEEEAKRLEKEDKKKNASHFSPEISDLCSPKLTPKSSLVRSPKVTFAQDTLDVTLSTPTHSPQSPHLSIPMPLMCDHAYQLPTSPLACDGINASCQPSISLNSEIGQQSPIDMPTKTTPPKDSSHHVQYFVFPEILNSNSNNNSNEENINISKLSVSGKTFNIPPMFQILDVPDVQTPQSVIIDEESSNHEGINFPCTLEEIHETPNWASSQQSSPKPEDHATSVYHGLNSRVPSQYSKTSQDNKYQSVVDTSSPQQKQPLTLSLYKAENTAKQSVQEVIQPHKGNVHGRHLNTRLKPIPVSSPTNSPEANVPQQSSFQNDCGKRYQPTNKGSPCLFYVVRSPKTLSRTNEVTHQPDNSPHAHYQQTNF